MTTEPVNLAGTGGSESEQTLRRIALAALAAYDLPRPVSVRPIRLLNNAVFEVAGNGVHLALRIHRPGYRSAGQIRSELSFLQLAAEELSGSAVAVPVPVTARNGELIVGVGDGDYHALTPRYCDLLTWIDGQMLKHGRGLGMRSAFLLGEGLGRLHNAAEQLDAAALPGLPQWDADAMFTDASPFQPGRLEDFLPAQARTVFQEVADRTRAVFGELGRGRSQWGVIHNDCILINCHFKRSAGGGGSAYSTSTTLVSATSSMTWRRCWVTSSTGPRHTRGSGARSSTATAAPGRCPMNWNGICLS
jgi:Ser/Thr protein kinase RdoA (MazF antagonist)